MKTTLVVDDELFRRAKLAAAERGITFTRLVHDALSEHLASRAKTLPPFKMRVVKDSRPPAVDPADRDALYALLEDDTWLR